MKSIDLKKDQSNLAINKIWDFQKEIERKLKNAKTELNQLTAAVEVIKIESQDQIIQKDNK